MADKLMYSTSDKEAGKPKKKGKKNYEKGDGPTKMRLEKKGRGGKQVTVLYNLSFEEAEARKVMKSLQGSLACGATFKDSRIELRGDLRDQVELYFKSQGWKLTRSGG